MSIAISVLWGDRSYYCDSQGKNTILVGDDPLADLSIPALGMTVRLDCSSTPVTAIIQSGSIHRSLRLPLNSSTVIDFEKRLAMYLSEAGTNPQSFPLRDKASLVFGRSEKSGCQVILNYPFIGRRHFQLERSGDTVTVKDLNSTNGLFLNGKRVKEAKLQEGDVLSIFTVRIFLRHGSIFFENVGDELKILPGALPDAPPVAEAVPAAAEPHFQADPPQPPESGGLIGTIGSKRFGKAETGAEHLFSGVGMPFLTLFLLSKPTLGSLAESNPQLPRLLGAAPAREYGALRFRVPGSPEMTLLTDVVKPGSCSYRLERRSGEDSPVRGVLQANDTFPYPVPGAHGSSVQISYWPNWTNCASYLRDLSDGSEERYLALEQSVLDSLLSGAKPQLHLLGQSGEPESSPAPRRLVAVAAGSDYSLGLCLDGSVLTAGHTIPGGEAVSAWREITALACGQDFAAGLTAEGRVLLAGPEEGSFAAVKRWRNIAAIAAGRRHLLALTADGRVLAAGADESGQCQTSAWQNVSRISAGGSHSLGITAEGRILFAGDNARGQCTLNESRWRDLTAVAAGTLHSLGLRSDGTVLAVGNAPFGQCRVAAWTRVTAIAAGNNYSLALLSDGRVLATGDDRFGQCSVGSWRSVVAVAAGAKHCLALTADGKVLGAGCNDSGQLDLEGWTET